MLGCRIARRILPGLTAAVWALSACSSAEPVGPPVLTADQALQEYRTEAATLRLAPGAQWPEQPIPAQAEDGLAMIYEPGFGRQAADSHWFCSWSGRVLDLTVTPGERESAVEELAKIRSTYFYTKALAPESRPVLDRILNSTQLGDYGPLRMDYEMNCTPDGSAG